MVRRVWLGSADEICDRDTGLAVTEGEGKNKKVRPLRLIYDLRRAAVRNMVRAGVDPAIAMKLSEHRTRAIFDRHNIIDERDLRDAMEKTTAYIGHNTGSMPRRPRRLWDPRPGPIAEHGREPLGICADPPLDQVTALGEDADLAFPLVDPRARAPKDFRRNRRE